MVRLTRAQQQERTRAAVLAAAEVEFACHGYDHAKVDRIAERSELTRGAVYSNFPGKRALYLAVLLNVVERSTPRQSAPSTPSTAADAVGALARVWLERLPLGDEPPTTGHLQLRAVSEVLVDQSGRSALAQVMRLEALLLAVALEASFPESGHGHRQVRLAEMVITLLNGSARIAETAPTFGDPFDVALACEQLAGLDFNDTWDAPHLPYAAAARSSDEGWEPQGRFTDLITGRECNLDDDGVLVVVGAGRLAAAEEAVRAIGSDGQVTVVVVSADPAVTGRLIRLRITDFAGCLRRVFADDAWPQLRLVIDENNTIPSALGLHEVTDATETAVRIREGRTTARADGRGAAYSAAAAGSSTVPGRSAPAPDEGRQ